MHIGVNLPAERLSVVKGYAHDKVGGLHMGELPPVPCGLVSALQWPRATRTTRWAGGGMSRLACGWW